MKMTPVGVISILEPSSISFLFSKLLILRFWVKTLPLLGRAVVTLWCCEASLHNPNPRRFPFSALQKVFICWWHLARALEDGVMVIPVKVVA
jgi:hypothetical protein